MKEVLKIPLKATLYRHQQSACRFACERFGILPSETHSNGVALLMERPSPALPLLEFCISIVISEES